MFDRCLLICSYFFVFLNIICVTADNENSTSDEFKYNKYFKNASAINATTSLPETTREVISQVISTKCNHQYSLTCLKIDLGKLLDKLVTTKSFQILPGISLVNTENNINDKAEMPVEVAVSIVRSSNNSNELNSYLLEKVASYVGSLSIRVNLLDNPIIRNLKDVTYGTFHSFFYPIEESGRSKKGKNDMHAAIWSAAMLAALAFSGLAALAGKAMITGALALLLSLICLLKGCGGHRAAHYEIITKPAHLHDVEQIGYPGALGSSTYGGYARQLIQDRIIPALNILDTNSEEKEVIREVIPIHTYQISPNMSPTSTIHR